MATPLLRDKSHTAVLIMDYQNDIVSGMAANHPQLLDQAAAVLGGARLAGLPMKVLRVLTTLTSYKRREIERTKYANGYRALGSFFALDPARARSAQDRAYGSGIRQGEEDAKSAAHGA